MPNTCMRAYESHPMQAHPKVSPATEQQLLLAYRASYGPAFQLCHLLHPLCIQDMSSITHFWLCGTLDASGEPMRVQDAGWMLGGPQFLHSLPCLDGQSFSLSWLMWGMQVRLHPKTSCWVLVLQIIHYSKQFTEADRKWLLWFYHGHGFCHPLKWWAGKLSIHWLYAALGSLFSYMVSSVASLLAKLFPRKSGLMNNEGSRHLRRLQCKMRKAFKSTTHRIPLVFNGLPLLRSYNLSSFWCRVFISSKLSSRNSEGNKPEISSLEVKYESWQLAGRI